MAINYPKIKLSDNQIEIIDGDRGVNYPKKSDFSNDGYCLFLDASNVTKNGFLFESTQFISYKKDKKLRSGKLQPKDIVLTTRGTIGNFAYYATNIPYDNIRINSGMLIIRNNGGFETKYLYQLLKSPFIKKQINNITTGSSQPQLTRTIVEELILFKPELHTQQKIASVLSTLDDKIELNNKINAELEAMAKLIYDYWFVQFDFPDENGKPYKSSGGKMRWSEELKREIPEGWEVRSLLDVADWIGGAQPSKSVFKHEPTDGYIRFIQNRDYAGNNYLTFIPNAKSNKICDKYSIMMDKYGDAGRIRFGLAGAYNVALAKIHPKLSSMQEYLRGFLGLESTYQYLFNACMASTRASLNGDILGNLNIVVPPKYIREKYELFGKNIMNQVLATNEENHKLSQLRDWLLPMLMNGQVEVKL